MPPTDVMLKNRPGAVDRPFDTGAVAGIGLDQAGVNREAFTTDQPLVHATLQHGLKETGAADRCRGSGRGGSLRRSHDRALNRRDPIHKTSDTQVEVHLNLGIAGFVDWVSTVKWHIMTHYQRNVTA